MNNISVGSMTPKSSMQLTNGYVSSFKREGFNMGTTAHTAIRMYYERSSVTKFGKKPGFNCYIFTKKENGKYEMNLDESINFIKTHFTCTQAESIVSLLTSDFAESDDLDGLKKVTKMHNAMLEEERKAILSGRRKKPEFKLAHKPLPKELATKTAMKYWKKLQKANFVDENYLLLPEVSNKQAMYIAKFFADQLLLTKKWKLFEEFWGRSYFAQEFQKMTKDQSFPPRNEEIETIFED